MIVKIIVGVFVLTAFFVWTMIWFIRSSVSENPRVRRRLQFVDGLMSVGIAMSCALGAANGKERNLALIVSGVVIALWLFRVARMLLHREKA